MSAANAVRRSARRIGPFLLLLLSAPVASLSAGQTSRTWTTLRSNADNVLASTPTSLLALRGGAETATASAASPAAASSTSPLAAAVAAISGVGPAFASGAILCGAACAIAPGASSGAIVRAAGLSEHEAVEGGTEASRFLVRAAGALAVSLGVTAGVALGTSQTLERAVGFGLVPRIAFLGSYIFGAKVSDDIRLNPRLKTMLFLGVILSTYSLIANKLNTSGMAMAMVVKSALIGGILFLSPGGVFAKTYEPSRLEKLAARMGAVNAITSAVLMKALIVPSADAVSAVGLSALSWLSMLVFTAVTWMLEKN